MSGKRTAEGEQLYRRLRSHLILQGIRMEDWCARIGTCRAYAYQAITGGRSGPVAAAIVAHALATLDEGRKAA